MELNNIKLFAQNTQGISKTQEQNIVKEEENKAEVKDNKPADKQVSEKEVFAYLANQAVNFKAKVDKKDGQEARIAGFMADFEEAFGFAKELGLSDEAAFQILDRI